jgi:hypothetical protein
LFIKVFLFFQIKKNEILLTFIILVLKPFFWFQFKTNVIWLTFIILFFKLFCLFQCNKNEFTCGDDGSCISLENRCDIVKDCTDKSDESKCQFIVLDDYLKEDPPIKGTHSNYACWFFRTFWNPLCHSVPFFWTPPPHS